MTFKKRTIDNKVGDCDRRFTLLDTLYVLAVPYFGDKHAYKVCREMFPECEKSGTELADKLMLIKYGTVTAVIGLPLYVMYAASQISPA